MKSNEEAGWRDAILRAIQDLGHRYAELYSEQGQLDHYNRLMGAMQRRFDDPALTRSAFLHGIPTENIKALQARVAKEELKILREWEQLRQLDPSEEDFAERLENEIISHQLDVRSAILLVCERLDRLDPDGHLEKWVRRFRHRPLSIDPVPSQPERVAERFFRSPFADFAEKVAAPIAEALGLWQERCIIRNAALYLKAPGRFQQLVAFAVERSQQSTWCDDHVATIRKGLKRADGMPPESDFLWEWRHVASLEDQLGRLPRALWEQKAHLCGFVSIKCPDAAACYGMLGEIHKKFSFRVEYFRDAIGNPTRSGYQALHTCVLDPREEDRFLALRMLPRESERPTAAFLNERLLDLRLSSRKAAPEEIIVFTPQGRPRFLPRDATVLNLASILNRSWVGHVHGALLNEKLEVDVFHRLSSRDVVELHMDERPRLLPDRWEEKVPVDTVPRIRDGMWEAFRTTLERAGREYVLRGLIDLDIDEGVIRILLESGLADLLEEHPSLPGHGVSWWCCQLGLLRLREKGDESPFELALTDEQASLLLKQIKTRVRQVRTWGPVPEVDPRQAPVTAIRHCPECQPGSRSQLAFKVSGETLVIHRRGERCARGADLVHRKVLSLDQYFVIETINRVGMAKEVLTVFADKKVDVVELVARQLASTWGVARVEVEPIGPVTVRSIKEGLLALEGVVRVFGPGDDEAPPVLLKTLPPRLDVPRSPLSQPPPYICGPVIYDHHYFYGRENEMNLLYQLLDRVTPGEAEGGLMIFVSGPLKVGKTSLVRRFQRQLELRQDHAFPCVNFFHKTAVQETWNDVESALVSQVRRKSGKDAKYWQMPELERHHGGLRSMLNEVTASENRPMIVIAIDEVVRLFKNTQRDSAAVGSLQAFREFIDRTPGIVVIWIGPLAPVKDLDLDLLDILMSSQPLPAGPLSLAEAKAMLVAEKLAPIHQIEMSGQVARSVHELTAGDPFWIAHLGYAMWRHSGNGKSGPMRFTAKELQRASMDLIQQSTIFQGKIFPSGLLRKKDRLIRTILFLIVRNREGGSASVLDISTEQLRVALLDLGIEKSRHELEQIMEELAQRGGVSRSESALDRWRISAPLLAKHLSYHFEKTGWEAAR